MGNAASSASVFQGDSESWRDRLSLRLSRGFFVVFLIAAGLMAATLSGALQRWLLTGVAAGGAIVLAIPALTRRPRGRARAWFLIVPCLVAATVSLLLHGFLSAPGVIIALTLMLSGILLGRRTMWALGLFCVAAIVVIAWSMVTGRVPAPPPLNTAFTNPFAWARTMGVSILATGMFGSLTVAVIDRMEQSLLLARSEVLRREQAERERAEARQLETVGRLAAGVAHDFNNNLTAIIGCAELLQGQLEEGSQKQALAQIIVESSRRAAELTGQLLAYSRQAQMLMAPTDVHRAIESATSLLRRSMDPSVELEIELGAELSIVEADETLLHNALLNLLVNACDAMPEGGKLEVLTSNHDRQLHVDIKDSGSGIPEEALSKIFEPFFTTKPLGQGTGLGLAAVAGTARSLGGSVTVETKLGQGSVFRLSLPLGSGGSAPAREEAMSATGHGELLLVDDQPQVLRAASLALGSLGYRVVAVGSGADAVREVEAAPERFDLILLDLRMPDMGGEATFDALIRINPSVRVLVWSGYGAEEDLPEMLRRGAIGFLPKPYGIVELSRAVARGIRRRPEPVVAGVGLPGPGLSEG